MKKIIIESFFSLLVISIFTNMVWAEIFKVGVQLSLSGANANGGNNAYEGVLSAIEIFNRESGHTIELITVDDESRPATASSAVEQLISRKVIAILGGTTSDSAAPAAGIANREGIPYVSGGATSDEILTYGYKTFFRINNMQGYVKALSNFMTEMMPDDKNITIMYSTQVATNQVAQSMKKILKERGIKVKMHGFNPNTRDFIPLMNKIRLQDKPDIINILGYENDYVGIIRAAKVLKPDIKALVGIWYITNRRMAAVFPDIVENVFGGEFLSYPINFKTAEGKKLEGVFNEMYKKTPDYANIIGYVQTTVLLDAIVRAYDNGRLHKKDGLLTEIRATNMETMIGHIQFDERGDNTYFMPYIAQHQDGKIVIVWPKEHATGEMRYPALPW